MSERKTFEEKNDFTAVEEDDDSSSDEEEEECHQCKVVVLGDGAVGKTSLIHQFVHGEASFDAQYCQTIGLNFYSKVVEIPRASVSGGSSSGAKDKLPNIGNNPNDPIKVRLQLWDIGGQSLGSKMISNYIFNANIVLLVYDGTSQSSFNNLQDWYSRVLECQELSAESGPEVVLLVGNKCDLASVPHKWLVKQKSINAFLDANIKSKRDVRRNFEVSAKTGENVSLLFFYAAEWFIRGSPNTARYTSPGI
eukprot:g723.t1